MINTLLVGLGIVATLVVAGFALRFCWRVYKESTGPLAIIPAGTVVTFVASNHDSGHPYTLRAPLPIEHSDVIAETDTSWVVADVFDLNCFIIVPRPHTKE